MGFMTRNRTIIELAQWWESPPGRYLLAWEQSEIDALVGDVFGFHALQLGLPQLAALRANRMPHRWLASDVVDDFALDAAALSHSGQTPAGLVPLPPGAALVCDFDALPFPNQSLDLVVMPHALELARDPHDTLREVERVLVPEGRVVIIGFNPASSWGLRQRLVDLRRRLGLGATPGLPRAGDFIGYRRVRDWLRLLGFEAERARFGCWRPPLRSDRWLERWRWIDAVGERAFPVLGALYAVVAVKRVRGMRLVGLARRRQTARQTVPAVVANRQSARRPTAAAPAKRKTMDSEEQT